MDWNDLRYFLAIHRAGTLSGAARSLKVEHSTVSRRLAALEDAVGARLFLRGPDGFTLTAAGAKVVPIAESVEGSIESLARQIAGEEERVEGTVRLTTSEGLTGFLVKRLGRLRASHPALVVEVLSGNQSLDLARGQADIAVRMLKTEQPELLVRKVADMGWSLYAAEGYLAGRCAPPDPLDLTGHDVIGFEDSMASVPGAQWLAAHAGGTNVVLRGNSIVSALNAAIAGIGLAVLPCFIGDAEATLRRLTPDVLGSREAWLVVHPDLAQVPRVRVVMEFVVAVMTEEATSFRGHSDR